MKDLADKWMEQSGNNWGDDCEPIKEHKGRKKTCDRCGEPGLYWERKGKKWIFVNEDGEQHFCSSYVGKGDVK